MNKDFIHKTLCHSCEQSNFAEILNLGEMPLANSFLEEKDLDEPDKKFPLVVYFCKDCGLVQLLDVVNPEILFSNYDYLTSASKPLVEHFTKMGGDLSGKFIKSKNDLFIEIGGNDAVLLNAIKNKCRVLNIEPAKNVAEISRQKGIETINEFFNKELAEKIVKKYGNAKVVVANNVMAHIADIKSVFGGIRVLIGKDGVFVFEVHRVSDLIEEGNFDQIYHEHLFYYSLFALNNLIRQFGLDIFDVEPIHMHGQSMRVFVGKDKPISKSVTEFLEKEKDIGLDKLDTFLNFSEKVEKRKIELTNLLDNLKKQNKRIVGYGAPAKGNTLLNYFQIDNKILDFLTDTTPLKQGLYTPGTRIPIFHPDKLKEMKPDYVLLLAWNYADAILEKEKELREQGVKFIIPAPFVRVV
ncbi:MAG: class I SAM-dependent methyltransferase [Patescibacteria group bacterium]|nr:class I SAM-dependent methyltransferase [Patescibacteria group bacterium]